MLYDLSASRTKSMIHLNDIACEALTNLLGQFYTTFLKIVLRVKMQLFAIVCTPDGVFLKDNTSVFV